MSGRLRDLLRTGVASLAIAFASVSARAETGTAPAPLPDVSAAAPSSPLQEALLKFEAARTGDAPPAARAGLALDALESMMPADLKAAHITPETCDALLREAKAGGAAVKKRLSAASDRTHDMIAHHHYDLVTGYTGRWVDERTSGFIENAAFTVKERVEKISDPARKQAARAMTKSLPLAKAEAHLAAAAAAWRSARAAMPADGTREEQLARLDMLEGAYDDNLKKSGRGHFDVTRLVMTSVTQLLPENDPKQRNILAEAEVRGSFEMARQMARMLPPAPVPAPQGPRPPLYI